MSAISEQDIQSVIQPEKSQKLKNPDKVKDTNQQDTAPAGLVAAIIPASDI